MATSRVIAYCMHESELGAATSGMQPVEVTESFVVGDADEAQIADMRAKGLIVEIVGEQAVHRDDAVTRAVDPGMLGGAIGGAEVPAGLLGRAGAPNYYLMWINGPMLADWRAQLEAQGVQVLERYPNGATKVRLEPAQVAGAAALPFVTQLRAIDGQDAGPRFARAPRAVGDIDATGRRMLTFDIRLSRPGDGPEVMGWLADNRIAVAGNNDRKIRVFLLENDPLIVAIPGLPGVASFEQYIAPHFHNDIARQLLSIDANPAGALIAQTGDGQIVAVADTGIDDTHPDFAGRIIGKVALGRATADDPN